MSERHPDTEPVLDAGAFGEWVTHLAGALRDEHPAEVPCGPCTGCCTASQFVVIGPEEADALAHIPDALLFPAPFRPGHKLLGYDEHGRCPMLLDGRCSIYEHRPRACRTYDCRVFPAAGVRPDSGVELTRQVARWRFGHPSDDDRVRHDATRAAARFLEHAAPGPDDGPSTASATQRALVAVEIHDEFVGNDGEGHVAVVAPAPGAVRVRLRRLADRPPSR